MKELRWMLVFAFFWISVLFLINLASGSEYTVQPPEDPTLNNSYSIVDSSGVVMWFCPYEGVCNDWAAALNLGHENLHPTLIDLWAIPSSTSTKPPCNYTILTNPPIPCENDK